ncbi:MAG: hypothetical protein HY807_08385 [Nitrospirae bacterium]|nr:hypothetical protein [Nitrospirota bacterium]
MRKQGTMTYIMFAMLVCNFVSLFFVGEAAWPHDALKDARGQTFTDPSKTFPMPDKWIKQPIKYDKENKGADIVIMMDQDIYHTLLPAVQKYAKEKNLKINMIEGTCGIAAGMLSKKTTDMGGFCCPAGAEDRLPGLRFHTIGIVAKAFFVNPENPVDNISETQLRDLYRGKLVSWSGVMTQEGQKGPDRPIKTFARLHCPLRPGHWRQLLDDKTKFGPGVSEVGSIPDMISQVASIKDAIGWEVLSMAERNKNLGMVKPLKINGYRPNDSGALALLKYPFYRTYQVTTWEGKGVENPYATQLVEYLIKEFEKLDPDKFGFVSQSRLRKAGWQFSGDELTGEPK